MIIPSYDSADCSQLFSKINALRSEKDLCFAAVSDSALSDAVPAVCDEIKFLDQSLHFDFLVHLGDFLTGDNPQGISRQFLQEHFSIYRDVLSNGCFFPLRGDKDGWRDESFVGQLVDNVMPDPVWYHDTAFLDAVPGVHRPKDKPYYYVDLPHRKTRCIFLSSYTNEYDADARMFEQRCEFSLEQTAWLKEKALQIPCGYQVVLFSHSLPKSRFETGRDPFFYQGHAADKTISVVQQAILQHKIPIVGWFAGHYRCDWEGMIGSIPYVLTGSQTPLPLLSHPLPEIRFEKDRSSHPSRRDLWDIFLVKADERKLYSFRIGAGTDRKLEF